MRASSNGCEEILCGSPRCLARGDPGHRISLGIDCDHAREVDIQTSDASDDITITHRDDGSMLVEVRGRGHGAGPRDYEPPPSESGFVDVENVPPRDWGSDTISLSVAKGSEDLLVYLRVGFHY